MLQHSLGEGGEHKGWAAGIRCVFLCSARWEFLGKRKGKLLKRFALKNYWIQKLFIIAYWAVLRSRNYLVSAPAPLLPFFYKFKANLTEKLAFHKILNGSKKLYNGKSFLKWLEIIYNGPEI